MFTEDAEDRAKALVLKMEVDHHRREAESLSEINAALQEANARLEALATTDPLTHLPNHRALAAALDTQIARARRECLSYALLFLDIDHFKSINDTYGHPVGDSVLREFAAIAHACLREEDTLGRWGGEEFLVAAARHRPGRRFAGRGAHSRRCRRASAGRGREASHHLLTRRVGLSSAGSRRGCPREVGGPGVLRGQAAGTQSGPGHKRSRNPGHGRAARGQVEPRPQQCGEPLPPALRRFTRLTELV